MNISGAAALGLILLVPTALVCCGLLMGLNALHWPPAIALIGLANLDPRKESALALVALLTRPAAVIGLVIAVFNW